MIHVRWGVIPGGSGPVDGGAVGVGVGVDAGLQPELGGLLSAPRYAAHEVGEAGLDLGPGVGAGVLPAGIALRSVGGPGGVLTGARRDPLAASRCSDRRAPCPVSRSGVAGPTDHHRGREAGGWSGVEIRADVVLAKATVVPGCGGLLRRRDVVARIRETGEGHLPSHWRSGSSLLAVHLVSAASRAQVLDRGLVVGAGHGIDVFGVRFDRRARRVALEAPVVRRELLQLGGRAAATPRGPVVLRHSQRNCDAPPPGGPRYPCIARAFAARAVS